MDPRISARDSFVTLTLFQLALLILIRVSKDLFRWAHVRWPRSSFLFCGCCAIVGALDCPIPFAEGTFANLAVSMIPWGFCVIAKIPPESVHQVSIALSSVLWAAVFCWWNYGASLRRRRRSTSRSFGDCWIYSDDDDDVVDDEINHMTPEEYDRRRCPRRRRDRDETADTSNGRGGNGGDIEYPVVHFVDATLVV